MRLLLVYLWFPVKALLSLLIAVAGCLCFCALFVYLRLNNMYLALCWHTHTWEQEQTDKRGVLQIQLPLTIRKLNVIEMQYSEYSIVYERHYVLCLLMLYKNLQVNF